MEKQFNSTLSKKRIFITALIFFITPLLHYFVNARIENETLSLMLSLNFTGWALIIYDWNLFGIHYNRAKANIKDTLIFTGIGFALLLVWALLNLKFLKGYMLLPDQETLSQYRFALPPILIAFSYIQATIINICFKTMMDHVETASREVFVILLTGFLFGTIYTLCFTPYQASILVPSLLYNIITVTILSYLYNQTSSFISGILAFGTVYLVLQLFLL